MITIKIFYPQGLPKFDTDIIDREKNNKHEKLNTQEERKLIIFRFALEQTFIES